MVALIPHPQRFKTGARLIQRTARNKDKAVRRPDKIRVSYNEDEYDKTLHEMLDDLRAGERIYASADERDVLSARRKFNSDLSFANFSESEEHRLAFYRNLNARWNASLGAKSSAKTKLFLFDVDSDDESVLSLILSTLDVIARDYLTTYASFSFQDGAKYTDFVTTRELDVYSYPTKNGFHVVSNPFNPNLLEESMRDMLHTNALMLVAHS